LRKLELAATPHLNGRCDLGSPRRKRRNRCLFEPISDDGLLALRRDDTTFKQCVHKDRFSHAIKAVQAQLGHRSEQSTHMYAHLGSQAQLRLVESLRPSAPPHGTLTAPSKKKGT
jgi:integrase